MLYVTLSLSNWQYNRYKTKLELSKVFSSQNNTLAEAELIELYRQLKVDKDLASLYKGKQIQLSGEFTKQHILLDNQTYKGQVGYKVFSMFKTDKYTFLLDRGWLAANSSRQIIPDLNKLDKLRANSTLQISGRANIPYSNIFIKEPIEAEQMQQLQKNQENFTIRMQTIDLTLLAQQLKVDLYPLVIELDKDSRYAYKIQDKTEYLTPEKHLGYSVQWLALAVTLISLFLRYNLARLR